MAAESVLVENCLHHLLLLLLQLLHLLLLCRLLVALLSLQQLCSLLPEREATMKFLLIPTVQIPDVDDDGADDCAERFFFLFRSFCEMT